MNDSDDNNLKNIKETLYKARKKYTQYTFPEVREEYNNDAESKSDIP